MFERSFITLFITKKKRNIHHEYFEELTMISWYFFNKKNINAYDDSLDTYTGDNREYWERKN